MNGNYVFTSNIIKRNHLTFDKTNMEKCIDKKNKRLNPTPLKLNPFSLNNEFNYGIHNPKKFLSLSDSKENNIKNQDVIKHNLFRKQEKVSNEQVADKTKLMEGLKIPSGLLTNPKDNFDVPAYKEQIKRIQGFVRPIQNEKAIKLNIPEINPEIITKLKTKYEPENFTEYLINNDAEYKELTEYYEYLNSKLSNEELSERDKEYYEQKIIQIEDELHKIMLNRYRLEYDNLRENKNRSEEEEIKFKEIQKIVSHDEYMKDKIDRLIDERDNQEISNKRRIEVNKEIAKLRDKLTNVDIAKNETKEFLNARNEFLKSKENDYKDIKDIKENIKLQIEKINLNNVKLEKKIKDLEYYKSKGLKIKDRYDKIENNKLITTINNSIKYIKNNNNVVSQKIIHNKRLIEDIKNKNYNELTYRLNPKK